MSYFCNHPIYVLVPETDVTNEMINNYKMNFHGNSDSIRKSTHLVPLWLFKVRTPISSVFNGYQWYNHDEVLLLIEEEEWQDG